MNINKVREILATYGGRFITEKEIMEVYNKEFETRDHSVIMIHCLEEIVELIEAFGDLIKVQPQHMRLNTNTDERISLIEEVGDCEAVYIKLQMLLDVRVKYTCYGVLEPFENGKSDQEILKTLFHVYSSICKHIRGKDVYVEGALLLFKGCLEIIKERYMISEVALGQLRTAKVKLLKDKL